MVGQDDRSCNASNMGGSQAVWIQVSSECEFSLSVRLWNILGIQGECGFKSGC